MKKQGLDLNAQKWRLKKNKILIYTFSYSRSLYK